MEEERVEGVGEERCGSGCGGGVLRIENKVI